MLFALYCLLATLTTILLGVDTTAVMLTPVALALADGVDLPPLPFAFATIWLANAASLLLPIFNLSNLLAVERTGQSAGEFVSRLAPAARRAGRGAGGAVPAVPRQHPRRYDVHRVLPEHDRVLVGVAAAIALGIAVGPSPCSGLAGGGDRLLMLVGACRFALLSWSGPLG